MNPIANLETVPSPALLFDADAIERNLQLMLKTVGGDPAKLRPHIKTHKCREILERQLALGIRQVKCATIAEAELSALAGVPDVLLSYPLVGPNATRFLRLIDAYPDTTFSTLVDSEAALDGFVRSGHAPVNLFIDLDCGMHRTGVAPDKAVALAKALVARPELRFAGLHAYDGHIHDAPIEARREQFDAAMSIVDEVRTAIEAEVAPVPLLVSGGSPTFGLHAARCAADPRPRQCSPGTTVLWDCGYGPSYEDLPFEAAAFLLTRVVSHPGESQICVDLGHKAVAAENPIHRRVYFPALPDAEFVSQSEEHLVLRVADPAATPVGTELLGIPKHVCPTVALHQEALIVRGGAEDIRLMALLGLQAVLPQGKLPAQSVTVTDEAWKIAARDRRIGI